MWGLGPVVMLLAVGAGVLGLPLTSEEMSEMERLEKTHLRIVTIAAPPFVYESQVVGEERLKGFLVDVLEELQSRLNFTYDLYLVPDGKYGYEDTDGVWHGMVGELVYGKADMALAPLTMSRRRSYVLRYGAPFMDAGIVPLTQRPQEGNRLPFTDLMDLVINRKDLSYGAIKSGSTFQYFVNSKYPLFSAMGEAMRDRAGDVMARDVEEAAARVREGGYVFLGEEPMMEWLAGREPCDLLVVGPAINTRAYALAFPRDDTKTPDIFSWEIMSMKEDGTFQLLYRKYFKRDCNAPKLCVCSPDANSTRPDQFDSGEGSSSNQDYN